MLNVRRHNPALQARLEAILATADGEALHQCMVQLPVAARRTAGFLLGDTLLTALDAADYWRLFASTVARDTRAYLGTFLKAAPAQTGCAGFGPAWEALDAFAAQATEIDGRKLLDALLPCCRGADEGERLLALYAGAAGPRHEADLLMRHTTETCYYLLFRRLRAFENDPLLLRAYCLRLMKKGDRLSFGMARLVHEYFGLADLPGTFSLRVAPYELSRLDGTMENFVKLIRK